MNLKRIYTQTLENKIYKLFRNNLSEEYHIQLELRLQSGKSADIAISKGDKRLAIIEIKPFLKQPEDLLRAEEQVKILASTGGFMWAIVATDENSFHMNDCILNKNSLFKEYTLDAICSLFMGLAAPYNADDKVYINRVLGKLKELSKGKIDKIKEFIARNIESKIMVDDTSFYFENGEVEDELFECFINRFEGDKLCRYTSLSSFHRTINEGKQGLCGIVGMNDRSECTYADLYLSNINDKNIPSTKILYDAEIENSFFILSCMDVKKYDDLTMWRLYGDGTKGVNILYNVDVKELDGFKLYYIDYANETGVHPSLDFIGSLLGIRIGEKTFKLRRWNEWKHFFKPYEYSDELEIRLLYERAERPIDKWILNSDYKIVSPLVLFDLGRFPLVMEEVLLGPNCPEINVNQLQLELMIKDCLGKQKPYMNNCHVRPSLIGTYRS